MNMFNFFKNKKEDTKPDVSNSMDEYIKKQNQFKLLTKSDLHSVSDDDLRMAVMSWIWNKFDKDWSNQYEVVQSLPKPCRDVYSCCTVVDEINNGGLNQVFFNSAGQFVEMAREGFLAIGNANLSNVMEEAINVFNENSEEFEKYNDNTLDSFSESYDEELFNELDENFCDKDSEFDNCIKIYIRKNEADFGD